MTDKPRQMQIEIGGATAVATLLDDKAPIACQKLWNALPISGEARHSRWSGGAAYIAVDALKDPEYRGPQHPALNLPENFNSFLQIGTINYLAEHGELVLCYDQAQVRASDGNHWAARIAEVEGDRTALFAALAATQHRGETAIRLSRL
jgi:Protein of unknown function (DUF3830)